jgi:hypothetical protein
VAAPLLDGVRAVRARQMARRMRRCADGACEMTHHDRRA